MPDVDFVIYGIHGSAYTDHALVAADQGMLYFRSVFAEDLTRNWISNRQVELPIDISDFSAVIMLDPLFIIGGFMRWQLWAGGKGICIEFLPEHSAMSADLIPKRFRPISSSEWLAIFTGWRRGTIRIFETIRKLHPDIPILLLPPASPPKRFGTGIYPLYNRSEQAFLGAHLHARYNASFILQPPVTMDEHFQTLDEFHEPPPDLHHANIEYYRTIFDLIDFKTFSFTC